MTSLIERYYQQNCQSECHEIIENDESQDEEEDDKKSCSSSSSVSHELRDHEI